MTDLHENEAIAMAKEATVVLCAVLCTAHCFRKDAAERSATVGECVLFL
jgi:hypothetical protein